ncbi:bifunctional 2-polyprenyl-6-hydroxyphenol methylase/3-demethylubiquinol 3-O-methyltransferase UbiG [Oceanobacillus sp. CFH 90083]|uniref:class I SAM-dependent methyltransferase n=1 Tax=Oceanobacillus sp. CFH 90083 TaxID=2592336 RepID=UPI00128B9BDB|nr:class I SAM-dependent methyltransferase [Oceanobacillus sp. CFH 90083]
MTTNSWDKRFNKQEYIYGKEPNVFIQSMLHKHPSCDVLTIAEGEGRNAVYAAELGHSVTAWDYSSVGLDKLHQFAGSRNVKVKTELVDLTQKIAFKEDQWDMVISVFGHIGDAPVRQYLMDGIKKILRPGGVYIMEVYSGRQLPYRSGGGKDIRLLYTPFEVLHIFADGEIKHFYYGEVERHEGKLHNGLGHVIQLVAYKPH